MSRKIKKKKKKKKDQSGYESPGFSIKLDIAAINQWLMCLQQDDLQVSLVGLLSGLGKRCLNTSCDSMDRRVFDQGLGPHVSCPRQSGLGNRCMECLWGGSGQLCPVALIPHVIQQMTTFRYRIIILYQGGQGCLGFGSGGFVHKTPSKWVNLLTQPFSNRLHMNLHVWHLESGMNIMEDFQRKW